MQAHTHLVTLGDNFKYSVYLLVSFKEVEGNEKAWRKAKHTRGEHAQKPHTQRNLKSGWRTLGV